MTQDVYTLSSAPSITMHATEQGLQCGWAGCLEELGDETEWIKHVSIHVFTLKPDERTPWLGLPELDPDRQLATVDGAFFGKTSYDSMLNRDI